MTYPSGSTLTLTRDQAGQVSAIQAGAMQLNYTRDAAGQVTAPSWPLRMG